MEISDRLSSFVPFAAIAFLVAGLAWIAVANAAGKRARRTDGGHVFTLLAGAGYLTGGAFVLGFLAWLT